MLKVRGLSEYLLPNTCLSSYMYVHHCIKLDINVELCLHSTSQISRNLARTVSNLCSLLVVRFKNLNPKICANLKFLPVSLDSMKYLLEKLRTQIWFRKKRRFDLAP